MKYLVTAPVIALCCTFHGVNAHEVRSAYLSIEEKENNRYQIFWKAPRNNSLNNSLSSGANNAMGLSIKPVFPDACHDASFPVNTITADSSLRRWTLQCAKSLRGEKISIPGLAQTLIDAIVRIQFLDGVTRTHRLLPDRPSMTIAKKPSKLSIAHTYILLGVEHILFGFDHLLFVLALLILIDGVKKLIITITAFTIAHSVTLALASLGLINIPSAPVEAVIALSIVYVAYEILRADKGIFSFTKNNPWVCAFFFGLLHGLGFAGALADTGLPENAIPLALFMFNAGVEIGQLIFIAMVLITLRLIHLLNRQGAGKLRTPVVYGTGGVAAFWVIERIAGFMV